MSKLWQCAKYLEYFFKTLIEQNTSDFFIEKLKEEVLFNEQHFYFFDEIALYRQELKSDHRAINGLDFGAGSLVSGTKKQVRTFAKNSGSPIAIGELLFKLARFQKASVIFDLGTCLGFSALYLSKSHSKAHVHTFEGNQALQKIAVEAFSRFETNIKSIGGNIDEMLPIELSKVPHIDLAFIDANHRYEPTMNYFYLFLEKIHENSILVFDDIYWSKEMLKAWNEIKIHPNVSFTIDLHKIGIVFFKKGYRKQHFKFYLSDIYC